MNKIQAILILAGGESSRMGVPKALLKLPNGQTLLDFHLYHAKKLGLPTFLADNGKNFSHFGDCQTLQDYLPSDAMGRGQGALSAIFTGLQQLHDGYLLVVSCDTLLNVNQIANTLKNSTAQISYLAGKKDYPLLGVYHASILPTLMEFLTHGNRSVMRFLQAFTCQTFMIDDDLHALANFNTPHEFDLALECFYE